MQTIGDRVRKLRKAKKLTRPALAKAAGMSYTSLADLENGYQVTTTKLHRLAEILGVSANHLETGEPDDPPSGPVSLSKREQTLLETFRAATPDGKRAIEGAAAGVTSPFEKPSTEDLQRANR